MKNLLTVVFVVVLLTSVGGAFACGGMTQIDPPSLQLDAGPADTTQETVADDLQKIVVLC